MLFKHLIDHTLSTAHMITLAPAPPLIAIGYRAKAMSVHFPATICDGVSDAHLLTGGAASVARMIRLRRCPAVSGRCLIIVPISKYWLRMRVEGDKLFSPHKHSPQIACAPQILPHHTKSHISTSELFTPISRAIKSLNPLRLRVKSSTVPDIAGS